MARAIADVRSALRELFELAAVDISTTREYAEMAYPYPSWDDFPSMPEGLRERVRIVVFSWLKVIVRLENQYLPEDTISELIQAVIDDEVFRNRVRQEWKFQLIRWDNIAADPLLLGETTDVPDAWHSTPNARFFIGPIPVMEPEPLDITIVQNYDISGSGSLRTETEPLMRERKVRTRIDVDVIYPNTDKINSDFRQTIASLKACPFTTLKGPMVKEALAKKFHDDQTFEIAVQATGKKADKDAVLRDLISKWGTIYDPTNKTEVNFLSGDKTALENVKEHLEEGKPIAERIKEINKVYEASKEFASDVSNNQLVTVMFNGVRITSIPQIPQAIRARYTFWLVNDLNISEHGIRFRDANGDPTNDIRNCAWLKKYIDDVYLNPVKSTYLPEIKQENTNMLVMEYAPPSDLPDSSDDFKFTFATDKKYLKSLALDNNDDYAPRICTFVSAGFETKNVLIPLESEDVPGAQYLGRSNASGQIIITCDLKGVEALTHLKDSIQYWLRNNIKQDREHWILVKNPIINAIGVDKIIITNIVYKPISGEVNRYEVAIDWIENRIRSIARETLVYHTSVLDTKLLRSFMNYLWTIYDDYIQGRRDRKDPEVVAMLKTIWGHTVPQYKESFKYDVGTGSKIGAVFANHVFTTKTSIMGDNGLFNRDVLRASVFTENKYIDILKDQITLNWFYTYYGGNLQAFGDKINGQVSYFWRESGLDRAAMRKTYDRVYNIYQRYGGFRVSDQLLSKMSPAQKRMISKEIPLSGLPQFPKYMPMADHGFFSSKGHIDMNSSDPLVFFGTENPDDIQAFNDFYTKLTEGVIRLEKKGWDKMVNIIINRPSSFKYKDNTIHPLAAFVGRHGADLFGVGNTLDKLPLSVVNGGVFDVRLNPVDLGFYGGTNDVKTVNPWDNQSVNSAYKMLRAAVLYLADQFPNWADIEKAKNAAGYKMVPLSQTGGPVTEDQRNQLSCYPDMHLPTYRELFSVNGRINPIWKKFAPTYREMGRIPPPEKFDFTAGDEMLDLIVAEPDDFVEPSFFYHSTYYKQLIARAEQTFILDTLIGQAIHGSTIKVSWDFLVDGYPGQADVSTLYDFLNKAASDTGDGNTIIQKQLNRLTGKGNRSDGIATHVYLTASDRNVPIARLIRAPGTEKGYKLQLIKGKGKKVYDIDGTEVLDSEDPEKIKKMLDDAVTNMKDDKFSVRRMFPTFRFRLVDFSTGWFTDNVYDYNAVKSIKITQTKNEASLAVVELMNISGVLDNDRFLSKSEIRDLNIDPSEEPTDKADETQGHIFSSMKIREGTSVQILLGYFNNPNYLDTVFTGRISQIQPGQVLTLVAQDYKTELLNEVSWKGTDMTPAAIVSKIFQSLDGEDATNNDQGDVDVEDRNNGTPHLGAKLNKMTKETARKLSNFMIDQFGDENVRTENISRHQAWYGKAINFFPNLVTDDIVGIGKSDLGIGYDDGVPISTIWGYSFVDLFTDNPSRLRNCYFSNMEGGTRDWINVYQPAFDSIQELIRFMPGWVCQVLPYDHLGTLYIGPPEGNYFYTGRYNRNIVSKIKVSPRPVRQKALEILDAIGDLASYVGDRTAQLYEGSRGSRGVIGNIFQFYGIIDTLLERRSDGLGDMSTMYLTLAEDQPALLKYAIPAFFGFDMIEDENMPLEIRKDFWDVVGQMIKGDGGKSAILTNYKNVDGFKIPYSILEESTRPETRSLINDIAFANYFTEFDSSGIVTTDQNTEHAETRFGLKEARDFLVIKDPTGQTIPDVSVSWQDIIVNGKYFRFAGAYKERTTGIRLQIEISRAFPELEVIVRGNWEPKYKGLSIRQDNKSIQNGVTIFDIGKITRETANPTTKMRWSGSFYDKLDDYYEVFRWWFSIMYQWAMDTKKLESMQNSDAKQSTMKMLNETLADQTWLEKRPDKKPFRDYHLITSRTDIIVNNIVASTKEMYNSVLVRYPTNLGINVQEGGVTTAQGGSSSVYYLDFGDTTWKDLMDKEYGIPFHEDLKLEERKLLISLEKNAFISSTGALGWKTPLRTTGILDDPNKYLAASAFLSLMGESLRPMYRGNILLWGKVMKPHDWVRMLDSYNAMRGMFEVDSVTHNFDSVTGWTTTVVPHAVVHVNNATAKFVGDRATRFLSTLTEAFEIFEYAEVVLMILSLGGSTGLKALGSAAKTGFKKIISRKAQQQVVKEVIETVVEKGVGKGVVKAAIETGDKSLLKNALSRSNMLNLAEDITKKLGINWDKAYRHGMRRFFVWPFASDITGLITEAVAENDIKDVQGVVTVTPLIYQGRPLVAGLKMDDHIYKTRWEMGWKSLGDIYGGAVDGLTDFLFGKFESSDPQVDAHIRARLEPGDGGRGANILKRIVGVDR